MPLKCKWLHIWVGFFHVFVFIIKNPSMGELINWDKEQAEVLSNCFASVFTSK